MNYELFEIGYWDIIRERKLGFPSGPLVIPRNVIAFFEKRCGTEVLKFRASGTMDPVHVSRAVNNCVAGWRDSRMLHRIRGELYLGVWEISHVMIGRFEG